MRNARVGGKRANEERSEHLLHCFSQHAKHGLYHQVFVVVTNVMTLKYIPAVWITTVYACWSNVFCARALTGDSPNPNPNRRFPGSDRWRCWTDEVLHRTFSTSVSGLDVIKEWISLSKSWWFPHVVLSSYLISTLQHGEIPHRSATRSDCEAAEARTGISWLQKQ